MTLKEKTPESMTSDGIYWMNKYVDLKEEVEQMKLKHQLEVDLLKHG